MAKIRIIKKTHSFGVMTLRLEQDTPELKRYALSVVSADGDTMNLGDINIYQGKAAFDFNHPDARKAIRWLRSHLIV